MTRNYEPRKTEISRRTSLMALFGGGLTALVSNGCKAPNQKTIEGRADAALSKPKQIIPKDYLVTTDELPVYERGIVETGPEDSPTIFYPARNRDPTQLSDLLKDIYPGEEYSFIPDVKTHQLIFQAPGNRIDDVIGVLDNIDARPAQFRIRAYTIKGSSAQLSRFSSRLGVFIDTGNIAFALDSDLIDNTATKGVQHSISTILSPSITAELDAFLEGINTKRYVNDVSGTTINVENGDTAYISGARRVQVNRIAQGNPIVIIPDFTDVDRRLEVTPIGFADREVYLSLLLREGDVIKTSDELPEINTREISQNVRLKVGQPITISSTFDTRDQGVSDKSPLFNLVSGTETEQSRNEVLYILIPERIDISKATDGDVAHSALGDSQEEKP